MHNNKKYILTAISKYFLRYLRSWTFITSFILYPFDRFLLTSLILVCIHLIFGLHLILLLCIPVFLLLFLFYFVYFFPLLNIVSKIDFLFQLFFVVIRCTYFWIIQSPDFTIELKCRIFVFLVYSIKENVTLVCSFDFFIFFPCFHSTIYLY